MVQDMTAAEATNIIIRLTQEGWDANKINEFIVFIETHKPSEDEAMNSYSSAYPLNLTLKVIVLLLNF